MLIIDPAEAAVIKALCEDDFRWFVRYFFKVRRGQKFAFREHHERICDALMQVHRGEVPCLIINCPPRYSKTELVIVLFTVWCMVKNPLCEFIHLSYSDPLVMENSDAIKGVIKSAEFQQFWPHIQIRDNKDSKNAWATVQGGSFYARAAGGSVTGFGAGRLDEWDGEKFTFSGCLLIDDPLKPDDAHSDAMREGVNRRWDETIKNRRNSPRTPTIVIMQRIHTHDFCGMLLEDTEHQWTQLKLPALVDEGQPTEHALWPEKHTVADLKAMQRRNRHVFAGQYQQEPKALGGNIIKGAWFGRYAVLPPLKTRIVYADTAQKTAERNDYSVFECYGLGTDGRLYLLDLLRGKWEAPDLRRKAKDFWAKHAGMAGLPPVRRMKIEDKASGTGLIQDLKNVDRIPVEGIPRTTDKLTRVMDVVGYIESGYVLLPTDAPWVADFITECEAFTADDSHAHDDQIDPLCDAISDLLASKPKGFFS